MKNMRLWDIVLMNVTAIIGLRWLPVAAQYGAASTSYWILAALVFFIPLGLISSELATTWPDQGGMYIWVRKAYGEKSAFITSWFYWLCNLFYFPSILTASAVVIAFLIDPALKNNKLYVCSSVLVIFWILTLFNFKSLKTGKWLSNLSGSVGTILPGLTIIGLGVMSSLFWRRPVPTDFSLCSWLPSLGSTAGLSNFSMLMFAMAGIELTPILAGETENPQKTFPRATVISALIIAGVYIIATTALTLIISPEKIGAASGVMDATKLLADELQIKYLVGAMAVMILIGNFGGISVWIVCPIKMLFESTKQGVFPQAVTRLNREGMPQNALLIQAVFMTIIVLLTSFFPSVDAIYQALVLMATITYFIPYLLMFGAFIKLRKSFPDAVRPYRVPGAAPGAWAVTILGFSSVLLAIGLSFVPSGTFDTKMALYLNELGIGLGPLAFGLLGFMIYWTYEWRLGIDPESEV
ncbi:MAG: APC family permease [Candidatus Wallbacteria bacterium]|nr:APC family permease [Candidatus Wallbacteria bacterium]